MNRSLAWLCASCLTLCAGPALAKCASVATSPALFGSLNSTQVRTAVQTASTPNAGLQCNGTVLSVLSNSDSFKLTVQPATGGLLGPTGDVIPYTVYADATTNFPITRGTAFEYGRTGILDLLGLLNGTPKTVPLYLRTQIGSNVAAGVYQETLRLDWAWNYCEGIAIGGLCIGRDTGSGTQFLTISMTVTNDCQITTPNISFGSAPVVSAFAAVNQSLSVSCTKGSAYTVGLSDGQNLLSGRRRMKSAANNYLAYDIYKGAGAVRWGAAGSARRASTDADVNPGVGTGTGSQVFNYNARVYADQATPPAASYSDSVVLDVQF